MLLRIEGLPAAPLDAAAAFHGKWLERARAVFNPPRFGEGAARSADGGGFPTAQRPADSPPHHPAGGPAGAARPLRVPRAGEDVLLVLPPADHTHRAWRLAAVQELARAAAPRRVNSVASAHEAAIAATADYLARAEGVTGQYLLLADAGSGAVVTSAP